MAGLNLLALAAGLGTRLRPLSEIIPKPLLPIADSCALDLQLESVQNLDIDHFFANAHHLAPQMIAWNQKHHKFDHIFIEEVILGTGGPLLSVRDAGYAQELLVVNGDVYHNMDLKAFVEQARQSDAEIVLLCHPDPRVNSVIYNDDGHLQGLRDRFGLQEGLHTTFTGISWYSPQALARLQDPCFDIRQFWYSQIRSHRPIAIIEQSSPHFWIDMGSPLGYLQACKQRLQATQRKIFQDHPISHGIGVQYACVHGPVQFAGRAMIQDSLILALEDQPLLIPDGQIIRNSVISNHIQWTDLHVL